MAYGRALPGPVSAPGGPWALLQAPALPPGGVQVTRSTCEGPGAWASLRRRTLADPCVPRVGRPAKPHRRTVVQAGKEPGGSAPSWPWQGSRGCALSPRDQQALKGPGISGWRKFWGRTGRPKSGRPSGEGGASGPGWLRWGHEPWQVAEAGRIGVSQSRVPGAGESEVSRSSQRGRGARGLVRLCPEGGLALLAREAVRAAGEPRLA